MALHRVTIKPSAERELRKLDRAVVPRIINAVQYLADQPRPLGCRKLSGADSKYRIRIGNYRVVYAINDQDRIVDVLYIRHRKDAYT